MAKLRDDVTREIDKLNSYANESWRRSRDLKNDVERTSSESARIAQTLNHLAGKTAGDAADASVRHRENLKESQSEDEMENFKRLRARIKALRDGK
jgi:hypothetical protein